MSNDKREKLLVTSALPYANGPIHFGHIAGAYLPADIFVRYKKMNDADIIYVCGTDDHGVAITISAEAANRAPAEHVKINHDLIKSIFDDMKIQFDIFSNTSNETNHELSRHFFTKLNENGLMELKENEQLYCGACDRFLADRYVTGTCPHCGHEGARGDECGGCGKWLEPLELKDPKCKVCGGGPEVRKTANWYLKLNERDKWLREWLEKMAEGATYTDEEGKEVKPLRQWKRLVTSEIKGYLDRGLEPRAITRDLKWGVRLPEPHDEDGKVLYVWFDAPIGYIAATKELCEKNKELYGDWKEYWTDPERKLVHFIGKDNIPFHAMIFPIMLKGVGEKYNLPSFVAGNAFLNLEGRQFSKSEGWYIDPIEFLKKYPVDSIRYYLCAEMPEESDAEFRWESFQTRHNSELVNIYANLVNRTLKFVATKLDGKVPKYSTEQSDWNLAEVAGTRRLLDAFNFRGALYSMIDLARKGNKFFDEQAPWKSLTEDREQCDNSIRHCLELLKTLAVVSYPFIPDAASKIWDMLGLSDHDISKVNWNKIHDIQFTDGAQLPEPQPLFNRIDDKQIKAEKEKLGGGKAIEKKKQAVQIPAIRKPVTIDDFGNLDLRVAKILEAEAVPNSMKMIKLQVDIGIEKRQILAGIGKCYKPEELVGKLVVVVANLEPKKLMGFESQGMVMAAGDGEKLLVISPAGDIAPGSRVS